MHDVTILTKNGPPVFMLSTNVRTPSIAMIRSVYGECVSTESEAFAREDLEEAMRAIDSTISKCEKVQPKLRPGTSQHTLLVRRIKALQIAAALIKRELSAR